MKNKKLLALLCGLALTAGSVGLAGCPEEDDDDFFDKAKVEQTQEVAQEEVSA